MMKDAVDGKHEEGYKYLAHYIEEFKAKNLGSITFITWDYQGPAKNPILKHLLICVGPSTIFKQFCRPLIGMDACHLKGVYRGVLLTAMALDGNNGQFPLVYAMVEKENTEEWTFFLSSLVRAPDAVDNQSMYTIMSDRHKVGLCCSLCKLICNIGYFTYLFIVWLCLGNYKGFENCYGYCFKENMCHPLLQKFCITLSR